MSTQNNKKSSSSSSSGGSRMWSMNKISFWTIVVASIVYLLGVVLGKLVPSLGVLVGIAQSIVIVVMTTIVAIHAWKFVRNRQTIWIVLFVVCLLVILVGIILGLV